MCLRVTCLVSFCVANPRSACKLAYVLALHKSGIGNDTFWTVLLTHERAVNTVLLAGHVAVSVLLAFLLDSASMASAIASTSFQAVKAGMKHFHFCSSTSELLQRLWCSTLHVLCKTTA